MGGLEGLDPPAGSRGGAPGGGVGAKPPAGCAWSVRDCSGNPAGRGITDVILYRFNASRFTIVVRYEFAGCRGIVPAHSTALRDVVS